MIVELVVDPIQITVFVAAKLTVGLAVTAKEIVLVVVQPESKPTTVYVVLAVGETTAIDVVLTAGVQVKLVAEPDVDKVAVVPAHIAEVAEATTFNVGDGVVANETVFVEVQPNEEPVTVYVVFALGVTTAVAALPPTGAQV